MPKIPVKSNTPPKYQLYNESCFETFKRIPSSSVHLVLCDPPYGTTACSWDSIIPLEPMWKELLRIIKPNGSMIFTSTQPFTTTLISSKLKLFKYALVWKKTIASSFLNAHHKPMPIHEDITLFSKGVTSRTKDHGYGITYKPQGLIEVNKVLNGIRKKKRGKSGRRFQKSDSGFKEEYSQKFTNYPTSIIDIPSEGKTVHPTQKPVALMEYLIMTYSYREQTVLDFAMGSGTCGVAAGNLNRHFIGCDNDTEHGYFKIAEQRIREAYAKNSN